MRRFILGLVRASAFVAGAPSVPRFRRRPVLHSDHEGPHRRGCAGILPARLRHRRISLMHLGGVPWARIGEHVGQRDLAVTANTYTHDLADEVELDYDRLLE